MFFSFCIFSVLCASGYVYLDLHSEEQVEKALKKNKDYIGEKCQIRVYNNA